MKAEELAVIVYGVLAMLFAALLAWVQHSTDGLTLIFAAAAATYVFQALQLTGGVKQSVVWLFAWLSIILTVASVAVSLL